MRQYVPCLLVVLPFSLAVPAGAASLPTPMVDGDCAEYDKLPIRRIDAGHGIDLRIYEDEHYVWMCYTYPKGSLGVLDMKIRTAVLPGPLNLHSSAQLGEWPADRDDLAPKNPESDIWWNHTGWTGNWSWLNGMDRSGPQPRYRWRELKGRELQLSKQRFGRGDWQFAMTIYQVADASGKRQDVRFPAGGSYYTLTTR